MSRSPKSSNRVRVKLDLTFEVTKPVDSVPFGGQESLDALRFAAAKAIWKLLPKELRNKGGALNVFGTRLSISVDRRKP